MTAVKVPLRFISQYVQAFYRSRFFGEETTASNAITELSMADGWTSVHAIFARPRGRRRGRGNEEKRKKRREELRWFPCGRWFPPFSLLPFIFPRFPIVASCPPRCIVVPAFITTVIIISASVADESLRGPDGRDSTAKNERKKSWVKEVDREKNEKGEERQQRRNWKTERALHGFVVGRLVICSSDIIAKNYSEARERTYRVDYLSTDSTSLLYHPFAPSPFPSRLLPKFLHLICTSSFVILPPVNVPPMIYRNSSGTSKI